ncbi:hypothetical protein WR25_03819, partial [Diploscapter pachys]
MQQTYHKARKACHGVTAFDNCLKRCPESFEKSATLLSFGHWTTFCCILREPPSAVMEYFTCERGYIREARKTCGDMQVPSRPSLAAFCKAFDKYRNCFAMQPHNCTGEALIIKEKVDNSVLETLEKLLKMSSNRVRVPPKCTNFRHHRLRHHGRPEAHREFYTQPSTSAPTSKFNIQSNEIKGNHISLNFIK